MTSKSWEKKESSKSVHKCMLGYVMNYYWITCILFHVLEEPSASQDFCCVYFPHNTQPKHSAVTCIFYHLIWCGEFNKYTIKILILATFLNSKYNYLPIYLSTFYISTYLIIYPYFYLPMLSSYLPSTFLPN